MLLARFSINPNTLARRVKALRDDNAGLSELIEVLSRGLRPREKDEGKTSLWNIDPDVRGLVLAGNCAKARKLEKRDFLALPSDWLQKHGFVVLQEDAHDSFRCIKRHHYVIHLHNDQDVERLARLIADALTQNDSDFPHQRISTTKVRTLLYSADDDCDLPQEEQDGLHEWLRTVLSNRPAQSPSSL